MTLKNYKIIAVTISISVAASAVFAGPKSTRGYYPPDELGPIGHEDRPAPLVMRDDIPLVYNLPSPSETNEALIGPVLLLRSSRLHETEGTITLPLYHGHMAAGQDIWYVLTDTTNKELADHLGLLFSTKLIYSDHGRGARAVTIADDGTFIFQSGGVNYAPEHTIVPGDAPNFFPPKTAIPGAVGDPTYTPIVKTADGTYYNAPVMAYNVSEERLQAMSAGNIDHSIVHDRVVAIDPSAHTVTLKLTYGYSFGKPIFYLSTDSSDELTAALENVTYAPALKDAVHDPIDIDAVVGQPNERLAIFVNGPVGKDNPFRQGLNSAIADKKDPINIFGGIPTINLDYSPIWDAELVVWKKDAIDRGWVTRVIDLFQMFGLEKQGVLQGKDGGPIKRNGIIINCPVVARLI